MINHRVRLMTAALLSLMLSAPALAECELLFSSPDLNLGTLQGEQAKQPIEKEVALHMHCERSGQPQLWLLLPSRLEGVAITKVTLNGLNTGWLIKGDGCDIRERDCTRWLRGGQRVAVSVTEPLKAQALLTINLRVKIVPLRKGESVMDAARIETSLEAGALL